MAGIHKLDAFVRDMAPGEELNVERAMTISGLARDVCDSVLETRTREGAMMRLQHDAYVRCEDSVFRSS